MPQENQRPAPRQQELDPLVHLIQVVLAVNVVFAVCAIVPELQDGGELHGRVVVGYEPDAEDLEDGDVEN